MAEGEEVDFAPGAERGRGAARPGISLRKGHSRGEARRQTGLVDSSAAYDS